jgi:alkanesulfonate monooxygenase SsuD/methylene tetrahydromethanopterin reductase-like flavin-dependent oxidoreductase (luciferase family)
MTVEIGVFLVPDARDPERTVAQALAADEVGLDLVAIQDHPYQRRFIDTWALLAYLAGRTERVRLAPDVANLPLRPPALTAKAAASVDLLSGGRFELGLGAGAFWEAIGAMGGPVLTGKESVDALEEAIQIIRKLWSAEGAVWFEGRHYRLDGHKPGPPPAHPIGIWLGAYRPRMLRMVGRLADGWLPSLGRMPADEIADRHRTIDEAAVAAGREPSDIRRLLNVGGGSADELAAIARNYRFETLIVSVDDEDPIGFVRRLGEQVAPKVREALT